MVRGLVVRQVFIVLDILLAAALFFTAALVVGGFLASPADGSIVNTSGPAADMTASLRQVDDRPAYNPIVDNRLFGDAGAFDPEAAPREPEPVAVAETPVEETDLNLRLVGTTALDKFASAIIEDMDNRGAISTFAPGDTVVENVTLEEVRQRHVVIMNNKSGAPKRETLSMDDEQAEEAALARAAAVPQAAPAADSGPDRVTLNRQEFIQDLYTNYADLVTKVKPEMYRDASGNVVGITAQNIGQIPLASKLGLQDGDVLQSVNNESIDSEQKIMEMVQKYRNSSSFRIGIMRNGQTKTITYRLQ